jgi:hypothetical protein
MFAALNSFLTRAVSGYFLNKSLRFRSSASAYLNRTFGTPTAGTKYTISAWVKRGTFATYSIFSAGSGSAGDYSSFQFNTDTSLAFWVNNGGANGEIITTQLFRDPAAWYHVMVAVDTTQATASNRMKMYVNGTQVTSFSTANYPTLNGTSPFNRNATIHALGALYAGSYNQYFDGEQAEINFVDGQALAPTAFGAYSIYNQWLPIRYAGTYGTNGFYLPFTNTASTSTLVADSSGNGNNWTPNNISLTAGSTYDSLTDVPTLTSTTVANYAVLNPLSIRSGAPKSSDGNLTIAWGGTYPANALATIGVSTGKWYWEVGFAGGTFANNPTVGVAVSAWSNLNTDPTGAATPFNHIVGGTGSFYNNGTATANAVTFGPGDTVGVALNCDTNVVSFYKNNTLIGTAQSIDSGQTWFPFHANSSFTALTQYANYGQQPFTYTPPTGFLPLNTFNI